MNESNYYNELIKDGFSFGFGATLAFIGLIPLTLGVSGLVIWQATWVVRVCQMLLG